MGKEKPLAGLPGENDIQDLVDEVGVEAVMCYLMIQAMILTRKAELLRPELAERWLKSAAMMMAMYRELEVRNGI